MQISKLLSIALAASALATTLPASEAGAGDFSEGRWRLELSGGPALDQGSEDRSGDALITGYVDYEFPTTNHTALSLRGMPLFVYTQDDEHENFWREIFHDHGHDGDTVWGGGLGLAYRVYQKGGVYEGFFLELQALALGHSGGIEGDGSNIDFLTGIGLGYQFNSNWHAAFRFEHVSNAGLDEDNAGVNAVRLGLGYRF